MSGTPSHLVVSWSPSPALPFPSPTPPASLAHADLHYSYCFFRERGDVSYQHDVFFFFDFPLCCEAPSGHRHVSISSMHDAMGSVLSRASTAMQRALLAF